MFGSYAYGYPKEESNIDLLIIMKTNLKSYKQAAIIRMMSDNTFGVVKPIDIIVRTPDEIEKRLNEGDFFINKVINE